MAILKINKKHTFVIVCKACIVSNLKVMIHGIVIFLWLC